MEEAIRMRARKMHLNDLQWLTDKELQIVKETLKHLGLEQLLDSKDIYSSNALELTNAEHSAAFTAQNIQFNEKTRLEISTVPDDVSQFGVKVFHIENSETNKPKQKFVSNLGGEIIADNEEEIASDSLVNPDLLEVFKDLTNTGDGEVSASAWYDGLPCVGQSGMCCVIKEPLYTGSIPTIPVAYNWCGAGCGSGTPVNGIDTCCRTHDYCYGSFSSYPSRCDCDQNLINCVNRYGDRAASLIRSAFQIKMSVYC